MRCPNCAQTVSPQSEWAEYERLKAELARAKQENAALRTVPDTIKDVAIQQAYQSGKEAGARTMAELIFSENTVGAPLMSVETRNVAVNGLLAEWRRREQLQQIDPAVRRVELEQRKAEGETKRRNYDEADE